MPQQQLWSYRGRDDDDEKAVLLVEKPEHPEETTDLQHVTDKRFHMYTACAQSQDRTHSHSGVKPGRSKTS